MSTACTAAAAQQSQLTPHLQHQPFRFSFTKAPSVFFHNTKTKLALVSFCCKSANIKILPQIQHTQVSRHTAVKTMYRVGHVKWSQLQFCW